MNCIVHTQSVEFNLAIKSFVINEGSGVNVK